MSSTCPFFSLFSYFIPRQTLAQEKQQNKGYYSFSNNMKVVVKKQKSAQYKSICTKKNQIQLNFIKKQECPTQVEAVCSQIYDGREQIQVNIEQDQMCKLQFKLTPEFMYRWQPIIKILKSVRNKYRKFYISLCFDSQTKRVITDILKIALTQIKTICSPQNTTTFYIDIYLDTYGGNKQLIKQIKKINIQINKDILLNTEEYLQKIQFANQGSTII